MRERLQNSTTHPLNFLLVLSSDHITGATGITPTVTISKDGGAFASPAGAVTELGSGWYSLAGNATDRNTLGSFLLHATGAACDPTDRDYTIVAYDPFSASLGLVLAKTTNLTGLNDIAATAIVSGGAITTSGGSVSTVATVATTTTLTNLPAITTDWLTGTGVAASAVTKIQAGLATPTNITAGTITTVTTTTNLTNLPSAPTDWLSAAAVSAAAVTKVQAGLATAAQIPANFTTATFASAGVFATAALANAPTGGSAPTAAAIRAEIDSNSTGLAAIYARLGAPAGASLAADVATRLATAGYTAPPSAATVASTLLGTAGLTVRALDAIADAALTVGDCLVAAACGAAGKESVAGTAYVVKTPSTGTTIRTFTLDDATTPTSRS